MRELVARRSPRLYRLEGVVGVGLGNKWTGGQPTGEPAVVVYVRRKLSDGRQTRRHQPSIPRFLGWRGRRIRTDVVAFGRMERHALAAGASAGPAGALIKGTIGAYAKDLPSDDDVAITAMHVSGEDEVPGDPAVAFVFPSLRDAQNGAALGTLVRGTRTGVDAAKIRLQGSVGPINVLPAIGPICGWRPVVYPGDTGTLVRLYGATSGYLEGQIVTTSADFPEFSLESAIVARIATQEGDSGAAIVDAQGVVLGFLVGRGSNMPTDLRLFSPASRVLARLDCDIPTQWP